MIMGSIAPLYPFAHMRHAQSGAVGTYPTPVSKKNKPD